VSIIQYVTIQHPLPKLILTTLLAGNTCSRNNLQLHTLNHITTWSQESNSFLVAALAVCASIISGEPETGALKFKRALA
jgi:hypothetical protein